MAHAEAVIVSVLFIHMTAKGASPFIFKEYKIYAPTLLPTAFGKTKTLALRDLPYSSCELSWTVPVLGSIIVRKLMGCLVTSGCP